MKPSKFFNMDGKLRNSPKRFGNRNKSRKSSAFHYSLFVMVILIGGLSSCQKGNLLDNPNAATSSTTVPPTLILNRITNEIYKGGGVIDNIAGNQNEGPWSQIMRWNQYFVSNYPYYWGNNQYTWSVSASNYAILKYVNLMQQQAVTQYGTTPNPYSALAYFFKAYSFIWYTQRVGDIPLTEAGNPTLYPTPKYNTQHDVYQICLAYLDTANTLMGALVTPANQNSVVDGNGDIFAMTYLQWQKVINTYKLRVLISLSKRATDNPDLNIPTQFANIINNPTKYPIMAGNADNMVNKYLQSPSANNYPLFPNYTPYVGYADMANTFLNLTTSTEDPRTFIAAGPAPAQITGGKLISDFTAYVGADIGLDYTTLTTNTAAGMYSFHNYLRYYGNGAGPNVSGSTCEPYIIVGYPEMCFNIAEAANLGWITGGGQTWYNNGINASLALYGLADGVQVPISLPIFAPTNLTNSPGSVTVSVSNFLANPAVIYAGDNAAGLTQIWQQKYVAFWQNSGWEAYYNWRRTGVPVMSQGGVGIGTPNNMIPLRWEYPTDESVYNTANYTAAVQSQYGGTDAVSGVMWLIK
jgi:Starch-binding associating with outer membrane